MVKNKRRDNSVQSENKNNDTSKPGEPTISGSDMGHSSEGKQQRKKGDRTTHAGDTQSQIELTFQKQDLKRKRMSDGGGADAKKSVKVRKLVPPRPFPTVPSGSSATGPKSAHGEGKNRICITRRTALGAYLRRCKELVLKDGYNSLHLYALGAAIPHLSRLSISLPAILPFPPDEIHTEVKTGTAECQDEVIPEDEDEDISIRKRGKSTLAIVIRIGEGDNKREVQASDFAPGIRKQNDVQYGERSNTHIVVFKEGDQGSQE